MLLIIITSFFLVAFFYASYSIQSSLYVRSLCQNKTAGKRLALTFDDGVHPVLTPRILDILKENDVKATFFIIGSKAAQYPHLVKQIHEQGHTIGNHSYSHAATFPLQLPRRMTCELQKTDALLSEIIGEPIRYFRPPFGVTNPFLTIALKRAPHVSIGWSIRSFDTNLKKTRMQIANRIARKLHPGAVILLHDDRPSSDELLRLTLHNISSRGYKVVTIQELFNI